MDELSFTNESSTDDDLLLRQKALLARMLRPIPTNSLGNTGAYVSALMDRSEDERTLPRIEQEQRRRDLARRQAMADALKDSAPDLSYMVREGTKDQSKLAMKEYLDERRRKKESDRIRILMGGQGMPGGDEPPPPHVVAQMMGSEDKTIQAYGKALKELYYTPHSPGQSMGFTPSGKARPYAGMNEGYKAQQEISEEAKAKNTLAPELKIGNVVQPPQSVYERLNGPKRALPMSVAPPEQMGPPVPTSALPGVSQALSPAEIAQVRAADAAQGGKPYEGTIAPGGQAVVKSALPNATGQAPRTLSAAPDIIMNKPMQEEFEKDKAILSGLLESEAVLNSMERTHAGTGNKAMSRGGLNSMINKGIDFIASVGPTYTGENMPATYDRKFDADKNKLILNLTNQLKGNLSDKDIKFLSEMQAASTDNPATRAQILQELRTFNKRKQMEIEQKWNPSRPSEPVIPQQPGVPGKQSAADSPYWSMQAGVGEVTPTSALPGSTKALAAQRPGILSDVVQGFQEGLGTGGMGLSQVPGIAELVNQLPKVGRLKDVGPIERPSYEDVKMVRESLPERGMGGQAARFAGEMATDPTMYSPGGGILSSALKGVISGGLRPSASGDETAVNEALGGVFGTAGTLASKVLPPTAASKGGPTQEILDQAKAFGVSPSRYQLNPEGLATQAFGERVGNAAKPAQIEAITKTLLKEAGSDATRVSDKVIADRHKEISKEFEKLFGGLMVKVGSAEGRQLRAAIAEYPLIEDLMGRGPTLARIHSVLADADTKVYPKFKLTDIQQAIDDLGTKVRTPEGQQIKAMLQGFIDRTLGPDVVKKAEVLARQKLTLRDLETVWAEGKGQGALGMAGTLAPADLQMWAGRLSNDSAVGEAGGLVKGLGLHDYHPNKIPQGMSFWNPLAYADKVPGASLTNKSMVNAPDWQKKIVEALRLGIAVGPRELRETLSQE